MRLLTAVACASLMFGGAALAQTPSNTESAPQPQSPAAQTPTTPAASTPTATPAQTARTASAAHYTHAERVARVEMCSKVAQDRGLTGSARTHFMRNCHLEVVAR